MRDETNIALALQRLRNQQNYASKAAATNKRFYYAAETAIIIAGAAVAIGPGLKFLPQTSALLGAFIAVCTSPMKLFQFHENWLANRKLSEDL